MRLFQRCRQTRAGLGKILDVGRPIEEVVNRLAQGAVPVLVEAMAELLGHRPYAEHVDIGEVQVRLGIEVFVAQIASADDGHCAVCQPQFVVHASMLLRQIEQPPHVARGASAAAQIERVEQANLNVGVRGEGGDDFIQAVAGGVVQQDADAYAAICGLQQLIDQRPRAEAVVNDVVLEVQAGLGIADQFGPRHEGFSAVGQQAKTRAAFMRRGLSHDRASEGGRRRGQRLTGTVIRHRRMRAAADAEGTGQKEGQRPCVRQRNHPEVRSWR